MKLIKDLLNIFFPDSCLVCGTHLIKQERHICLECGIQLPFTEFTEFENNPFEKLFRGRIPIQAATSLLYFRKNGNTQKLIHELKYRGNQDIGKYFGKILGNQIKNSERFKNPDGIIMVPLHPNKLKIRGYNQLTKFAYQLAEELNIPVFEDVLVKVNQTASQTKKNKLSRFDKLNEKFQSQNLDLIEGKHILLIDDVLTTGATLEACANEILKAKNVKISMVTIAVPDH